MKGIVFTEFLDMVETLFGFETVDKILSQSELSTGGAYTDVGTYHHCEMLSLLSNLQDSVDIPIPELLETYGKHLFPKLLSVITGMNITFDSGFELLEAIDGIIHVEVKKLYPDAELPKFTTVRPNPNELQLTYTSTRPLAYFAKGLVHACMEHYDEQSEIAIESQDSPEEYKSIITVTKL